MVCSVCGHRNIDGVKFCAGCGKPTGVVSESDLHSALDRAKSLYRLEIWRRPRRPSARSSRPVKNWARPTTASEQFGLL